MFCIFCGAKLSDDAVFCTNCGKPTGIKAADAPVAESHAPEEPAPVPEEPAPAPEVQEPAPAPEEPAPEDPAPAAEEPVHTFAEPVVVPAPTAAPAKKKSKKGLTIALIAVGAVVVAVALFFIISSATRGKRYEKGRGLMNSGNYSEAVSIFNGLGSYEDSEALAAECQNYVDYSAAEKLFKEEKYDEAKAAFDALGSFGDSANRSAECRNYISYNQAKALFAEGKFDKAYALYDDLADFLDSSTLARQCIQPVSNGALYRNPAFTGTDNRFVVDNRASYNAYIKIYDKSNALVCSLYVGSKSSVTVDMPAGTYRFNEADGSLWFGENIMFGEDGTYTRMTFGEGIEYAELRGGYTTTLTLNSSSGSGESVGSENIDPSDF